GTRQSCAPSPPTFQESASWWRRTPPISRRCRTAGSATNLPWLCIRQASLPKPSAFLLRKSPPSRLIISTVFSERCHGWPGRAPENAGPSAPDDPWLRLFARRAADYRRLGKLRSVQPEKSPYALRSDG